MTKLVGMGSFSYLAGSIGYLVQLLLWALSNASTKSAGQQNHPTLCLAAPPM